MRNVRLTKLLEATNFNHGIHSLLALAKQVEFIRTTD
jgi:hypothetical protein